MIKQLNSEFGMTVLIVEQKLPFVRNICDRFCIMDKGKNVAEGGMADLSDDLVRSFLSV